MRTGQIRNGKLPSWAGVADIKTLMRSARRGGGEAASILVGSQANGTIAWHEAAGTGGCASSNHGRVSVITDTIVVRKSW